MRRTALLLVMILAGAGVFGLSTVARAQALEPPQQSQGRAGLFTFNPGFVFSSGYDTNPYRDNEEAESDVETYVIPQLDSWFTPGRFQANLFGAVEVVKFANRNGARNHQFGMRSELDGDRLSPFFSFVSKHTNANPTGFEVGRKSMRNENAMKGGVRTRLGGQIYASGFYWQTITSWDADAIYQASSLREKLNRTDNGFGGAVEMQLTPLTSIRFGGETTHNAFKFSPERDGSGFRFGPGVTFSGPAAIVGNVDVGIRQFKSDLNDVSFSGFVSSTSLTRSFPGGTFVGFRFDRDIQFSYDLSLAYFVSTSTEFSAIQPLGDLLQVQGFFAKHGLAYNQAPPGAVPLNSVTEYGVAAGRRLGGLIRVGTSLEWAKASGNQPWDEFRITAFMTFGSGTFQRLDRPVPFQR